MMNARRASSMDRSAVAGFDPVSHYSSCPPLPVIRQPQSTALSACDACTAPHAGLRQHESGVAALKPSRKAASPPYVITDKTPRPELLAIIMQLQADLTQRTDSVNAIQRNFERLSAMHHAEQLELRRLRLLEKTRPESAPDGGDAATRQLESVLAEMRHRAVEQQATFAQMEEELQAANRLCALHQGIARLIASHADGFRDVLQAEALAHSQLYKSAMSERAGIGSRHEATQQQLLCKDVAQLVADHQAQIVPKLIRGGAAERCRMKNPAQVSTATLLELVRQGLRETAEAVHQYVAATHATDQERVLTEAEGQRDREELRRVLGELLRLRRRATEEAEATARTALLFGALQTSVTAHRAFDQVRLLTANADAAAAATRSSWEVTAALLTRRISDWRDAADVRLVDFCNTIEASMAEKARERDAQTQQTAQELLLDERKRLENLHASQVQTMQADWRRQRDAVQQSHAKQLEQVRRDLVAQVQVAEDRRAAAERRTGAIEAALTQMTRDHAAEVQAVEAHWRSAVLDAERHCEQRWRTMLEAYQEGQKASRGAVLQLMVDVLRTRGHCVYEEQAERAALCRSHWRNQTQHLREEQAAVMQHGVATAVVLERMRYHTEDEAASRAVLHASEAADWAALVRKEAAHNAQVHHAVSMAAAAARLEGLRAEMAGREARWEQRLDALETDLRQAQQECLGAVHRASDAVVAAQEAQAALQATQRDFAAYRCGVGAAAQRIEVAESATESACCCSLCLELYCQPVACVPCGHIYCANCLLRHARNRSLPSVASAFACGAGASTGENGAVGARAQLEVTHWLRNMSTPHASLFCPECASTTVSTVVELPILGELTAKYDYKKRSLAVLLAELR
ncbi:hypothetical protein, unknown function [Leishmania infantum JPCM5]|uniref:Uncharacterized protein n=2 Tax=Leishmania infantum TaxID=5671 RepID=E9AGI6_LEIIN|nr:hypothetical protein, unknown function [Leishmania infantum JPCM5]CAC9464125.1 hypothetical_protein_-_conserved [Leishmania infantum]CBZ08486.1 hypothetical protein, unknown function [Leishmania infantum JPCM5]SUZ40038.1 hypothetical_protein_-_conserved [Leishmania infantum]|eukprot:XP_003392338.1 hypothetical protein, unknown function [Leishmania infantum JPCM5]